MLIDIIEVKPLSSYKLYLRFEDGRSGEVDVSKIVPFKGVFAKLEDKDYFATVTVNPDIGTICWENGADISPSTLYKLIKQ
jgi:hypothetical protein